MTRSRIWTLGTVVVVLAIFALGWFAVISPKKSNAVQLKAQAADTVQQNVQTEAKIRELKLQQKALPAQQAQIAAIQQQMPGQPQLPSLLRQVNNAADDTNVNLAGIAPGTPAPVPQDTGVAFIPVVITATGDFTHVKQFLFALEENKRAVLVTGFNISPADKSATVNGQKVDPNLLAITIQTRVFMTATSAAVSPAQGATPGAPTTGATTTGPTTTTPTTGATPTAAATNAATSNS